ncbi:hypothetical protein Bca4012_006359 [Brassica carinata]
MNFSFNNHFILFFSNCNFSMKLSTMAMELNHNNFHFLSYILGCLPSDGHPPPSKSDSCYSPSNSLPSKLISMSSIP